MSQYQQGTRPTAEPVPWGEQPIGDEPPPAPKAITLPGRRELLVTVVLAGVAAGGAFFGSDWDSGYMEAIHVGGTTFFATLSALFVALGFDPRRRA